MVFNWHLRKCHWPMYTYIPHAFYAYLYRLHVLCVFYLLKSSIAWHLNSTWLLDMFCIPASNVYVPWVITVIFRQHISTSQKVLQQAIQDIIYVSRECRIFISLNSGLFRIRRDDIEDEDDQESFFRVMKDVPLQAYPDDDEEIEYDSDGNPIAPPRTKVCITIALPFVKYCGALI